MIRISVLFVASCLIISFAFCLPANAHEVRPAYLELRQTSADTYDVLWKVPARGDDLRLGLYVRFPADTKTIGEPRAAIVDNAYTERRTVSRPGGLTGQTIHIDGLSSTMTDALARVERLDGTTQVARITPAHPSFTIEAAPNNLQVASAYFVLGVEHILFGIDHLLFVFALLLLVKGWRRVVGTVTAFTVAHSITLAAATLGFVHVPGPPVEAIIALSIVFVAAEIIHTRNGAPGIAARWPWIVAFTFGLLHGFGFAGALSEVGLPQRAIPIALLFFNVGVETGQLLFVAAVVVAAAILRGLSIPWPRWAELAPPYAIGGMAMFWVIQRITGFV